MNFLAQILSGPSGKTSTMRVATLTCVLTVMGTWTLVSIQKKELQPLTETHLAIVLGSLGIKTWQRAVEGKENEQPKAS